MLSELTLPYLSYRNRRAGRLKRPRLPLPSLKQRCHVLAYALHSIHTYPYQPVPHILPKCLLTARPQSLGPSPETLRPPHPSTVQPINRLNFLLCNSLLGQIPMRKWTWQRNSLSCTHADRPGDRQDPSFYTRVKMLGKQEDLCLH